MLLQYKWSIDFWSVVLLLLSLACMYVAGQQESSDSTKTEDTKLNLKPIEIYRQSLKQKRQLHKDAILALMKLEHEEQYKMVKMFGEEIFKSMAKAEMTLQEEDFTPFDPFPEKESIKEAFSDMVENTAFFGDILMHLKDISNDILKLNPIWERTIKLGLKFCNDSQVFVGRDAALLSLMAKELGIIQKESTDNEESTANVNKRKMVFKKEKYDESENIKRMIKEKAKKISAENDMPSESAWSDQQALSDESAEYEEPDERDEPASSEGPLKSDKPAKPKLDESDETDGDDDEDEEEPDVKAAPDETMTFKLDPKNLNVDEVVQQILAQAGGEGPTKEQIKARRKIQEQHKKKLQEKNQKPQKTDKDKKKKETKKDDNSSRKSQSHTEL